MPKTTTTPHHLLHSCRLKSLHIAVTTFHPYSIPREKKILEETVPRYLGEWEDEEKRDEIVLHTFHENERVLSPLVCDSCLQGWRKKML
jgi:hypothetical protein